MESESPAKDRSAFEFYSGDDDTPIKSYKPLSLKGNHANKLLNNVDTNVALAPSSQDVDVTAFTGHESYNVDGSGDTGYDFLDSIDMMHESMYKNGTETAELDTTPSDVPQEPQNEDGQKVVYICSDDLIKKSNGMIKIPMRASMIHSLIEAYGLLRYLRVEQPEEATFGELKSFHTEEYLAFLRQISQADDGEKYDDEALLYGLSYDCPVQPGVYERTTLTTGATLTAARCLVQGQCDVAINWYGGWHHAQKDSAAGFCYTNDAVLGILELRQKFDKVLYVDLDLHHADGVEDAFSMTNKVLTMSIHKYTVGFFPGTGGVDSVGSGRGKYYTVNVPLLDGIQDQEFVALTCRILAAVREKFQPDAVVCQCGADGIAGDPMASFNLTPAALIKCVRFLLSWKLPLLLLGGGGYHHGNTARCWAQLTALAVRRTLVPDIPDHQFLMQYGPNYDLEVAVGNKKDLNSKEYLRGMYRNVMENLSHVS